MMTMCVFCQSKVSTEEARKKIWLDDAKVSIAAFPSYLLIYMRNVKRFIVPCRD